MPATALGLVIVLALVGGSVVVVSGVLVRVGFAQRTDAAALSSVIVLAAGVYASSELLSLGHHFHIATIRWMTAAAVAASALALAFDRGLRATTRGVLAGAYAFARRQWAWCALNLVGLLLLVLYAPSNFDGLSFHMPRAAIWLQDGSLAHFPTHFVPQLDRPPFGEVLMAWSRAGAGTWDAAPLVQWLAGVLLAIATRSILIRLCGGLSRLEEFAVVCSVGLSPMVIAQTTTPQVDLAALAFGFAGAGLVVAVVYSRQFRMLPVAGLALGCAMASKGTAAVTAVAIAVSLVPLIVQRIRRAARPRRLPPANRLLAAAGIGLVTVLGIVLPVVPSAVRNWDTFGTLTGPEQGDHVVETSDPRLVLANSIRQLGPNLQFGAPQSLTIGVSEAELKLADMVSRVIGGDSAETSTAINQASADPWADRLPRTANYQEDAAASPLIFHLGALAVLLVALSWRRLGRPERLVVGSAAAAAFAAWLASGKIVKVQYWVNRLTLPVTWSLAIFALTACILSVRRTKLARPVLVGVVVLSCWTWLAVSAVGPTRPLLTRSYPYAAHRIASASYDRYFSDRAGVGLDYQALEDYLKDSDCSVFAMSSFVLFELPLHVVAEETGTRLVSVVPDREYGPALAIENVRPCLLVSEMKPGDPPSELTMPANYLRVDLLVES